MLILMRSFDKMLLSENEIVVLTTHIPLDYLRILHMDKEIAVGIIDRVTLFTKMA